MLTWNEYRIVRRKYFGEEFISRRNYKVYKKAKENRDEYCNEINCQGCDLPRSKDLEVAMSLATLAPLPKAVPCVPSINDMECYIRPRKEEGKNPMRYNDNYASANAYVATPQSDTSTQRDFLLKELANADYPKTKQLTSVFNLYVDNTPKTYKEMIDIIKAGTYTIDPKIAKKVEAFDTTENGNDLGDFHYGPMYGIVWPGPVADLDGYKEAVAEQAVQYKTVKRIIVTGDATAGLKALQDFEAWLPEGKSS